MAISKVQTCYAFLRAINVGGNNQIAMSELKSLFEQIGLEEVRTYINSGNVLFKTKQKNMDKLEAMLEKAIFEKFNLAITTMIRTRSELATMINQHPYIKKENDQKFLAIGLLKTIPTPATHIDKPAEITDEFTHIGKEIYLFCPNGFAETKLTNSFFEKKLQQRITSRNINTLTKLLSKSEF